jgi:hypothetical protein
MKIYPLVFAISLMVASAATAAPYSSYESKGEDYGDIYSTRGNRDIYTTEDDRQGVYTTKDSGSIYSSMDKQEGNYTTEESVPAASGTDVTGSGLMDSQTMEPDSVYDGYMPE